MVMLHWPLENQGIKHSGRGCGGDAEMPVEMSLQMQVQRYVG
jgi:hypothetical protein